MALAFTPGGRVALSEIAPPERAVLLLGAEGPGLPGEILTRATTVRIPMAGGFDSLNVATTAGIGLHHLARVAVAPAVGPTSC
jgi:tRNA G18 (ribose-2'-O)-methylase SpoU